jgi:hypothetical protein
MNESQANKRMSSEKFAGRERRCTHWPVGNLCGPRLQASSKFQRDFALFAARRAILGAKPWKARRKWAPPTCSASLRLLCLGWYARLNRNHRRLHKLRGESTGLVRLLRVHARLPRRCLDDAGGGPTRSRGGLQVCHVGLCLMLPRSCRDGGAGDADAFRSVHHRRTVSRSLAVSRSFAFPATVPTIAERASGWRRDAS